MGDKWHWPSINFHWNCLSLPKVIPILCKFFSHEKSHLLSLTYKKMDKNSFLLFLHQSHVLYVKLRYSIFCHRLSCVCWHLLLIFFFDDHSKKKRIVNYSIMWQTNQKKNSNNYHLKKFSWLTNAYVSVSGMVRQVILTFFAFLAQ